VTEICYRQITARCVLYCLELSQQLCTFLENHSEVVFPMKEKLLKLISFSLVGTGGPAPCRWAFPDR